MARTGSAEASEGLSVLDMAVRFMAIQTGGPDRALALHRRLPDGLCSGCLTNVTAWPCSVAALAIRAKELPRQT